MKNNKEIKEAITIKEVLSNDTYIIPIYQRNYEWEQPQIERLIRDINSIGENERYYLGTLVTFKRNDGSYELVDGQQRHTTLNLIKAVLDKKTSFNLKFQARSECDQFFRELSEATKGLPQIPKTQNLKQGVEIIESVLNDIEDKEAFRKKFFEQTYIFRTELPKETELNHYFEIMNNRGEQLEKHEILKALLMNVLKDDKDREVFAQIWEACSFMGNYIWNNGLPKELLEKEEFSFDDIVSSLGKDKSSKNNQHQTIVALLERGVETLPEGFKQGEESKTYDYRSVLEFPTFLLYIYHLINPDKEISFDDKKLLEIFKDYKNAKTFIVALLKYRIYFDKYVIKNSLLLNEKESNWRISGYEFDKEEIEINEIADGERKIEMLQTMFYYATVSNDKKEWLLRLLEGNVKKKDLYSVLKEELKKEVKGISLDKMCFDLASTKIFYYFEYMLWKVYYDYVMGVDKVISSKTISSLINKMKNDKKESFSRFYFRQLSSKEHLLPQNKISTIIVDQSLTFEKQQEERKKILHCFGNLCLISSSENSSAGKEHPEYKKELFYNNTSLKRLMMFETFSGNEWNTQEIKLHQKEMEALLKFYQLSKE